MKKDMKFTDFLDQPIRLCSGNWVATTEEGIYKVSGNSTIEVGYQPILITKRVINIENDTEKFEVAYYDQDQWKTKYIPRTVLSSITSVTKLVDYGIDIASSNARAFIAYIQDLYMYNKDKIPVVYSVSHLGWANNEFNEFIPYTAGKIVCDCEGEMKNIMQFYKVGGSYKKWLDLIIKCREKDIVKAVMAASFASPLIKIVGGNGFITHIHGDRGKGKTILLMLSMGIWGNPELGKLTNSINNTLFALECRAYFLQNLPFSGDELQNVNKAEINNDTLIYMIANGSGKGRGDKDQSVQKQKNWALNMLTTGEDKITKSNSHSGSKVRCIEIENDEDIFDLDNITEIANTIKENYGFAGKMFIKHIVSLGKDVIRERYKNIRDYFMKSQPGLDGKQINAISLLKLANQLAVECVFKGEEAIKDSYLLSLVKTEEEISVAERAKEYLLNKIGMNIANFDVRGRKSEFVYNSENDNGIETAGKGYRREYWGYFSGRLCFINKNVVDDILRSGEFSFDEVKRKWGTMKFINDYKGRYSHYNQKEGITFVQIIIPEIGQDDYDDNVLEQPPF